MNAIASLVRRLGPAVLILAGPAFAAAQDAQWIWWPAKNKTDAPASAAWFRKSFEMTKPESGEVQITCDDAYELYVNGRLAGAGADWKTLDVHDVSALLVSGKNTVAIHGKNVQPGSAGLVARVVIKNQGGTHVAYPTNSSWKVSGKEFPNWARPQYNDRHWPTAGVLGQFGKAAPWLDEVQLAGGADHARFLVGREFRVEEIVTPAAAGSLLAFTFNEFGQILASREGGPLLLIRDTNRDGVLDKPTTYSADIKNCQGLLALNGQVFAVGEGPDGAGLYRLSDADADGKPDETLLLLKFTGAMAEHGPHAPVLGPDGLIYVMLGNHTAAERPAEPSSPYRHTYEGDLVTPRYENAGGHAVGIKAPGGTVIRTDADGSFVETFAGGLRNAYDMAFNRQGDLLTSDSDMEWDVGLPWYRPARINHISAGSEFGWRSGWAVWPEYYLDSLPAVVDTGRGSPSGMCVYDHFRYPARYHNALFVGDWSRGRILAIRMKPAGASYTAESEVFVEGKPLNVTDLAAGPDGAIYFCTGGRGTEGGVYRIVWQGTVPASVSNLGKGLEAAIRQPQLDGAVARQRIATIKQQLGDDAWDAGIVAWARNTAAKPEQRTRALDLMQLFGPFPTPELLNKLSADASPLVRAKAAFLMGIHGDETTAARLVQLFKDPDLNVARVACEAHVRSGQKASFEKLSPLLGSRNRFAAWAARRALEQSDPDTWRAAVLAAAAAPRVFMQGAVSLMTVEADSETCKTILKRCERLLTSHLNDADFLDLLRVMQLALLRGDLDGDDVPELRAKLVEEFPSGNLQMNRELTRLLVHLRAPSITERYLAQLAGELPDVEKMHLGLHARFLTGWTTQQKLKLVDFYEQARGLPGGHSFAGYIENVSRDFFADFTPAERNIVLTNGARWPNSAISLLASLPEKVGADTLALLRKLDQQAAASKDEAQQRLAVGIVAVLARSGDTESMAYLRKIFEQAPSRRSYVAVALAQQPGGQNWPLLVQALPVLEGPLAQEVLKKLATVDREPENPETIRQVILLGLRLGENGGLDAAALLEKWTGVTVTEPGDTWEAALTGWQELFAQTYPELPEATLPVESSQNKHTYEELLAFLTSSEAAGDATRGAAVFVQAQCATCHRFGSRGETLGPDLTTVSQRFQTKEILESIVFPSHIISDQYAGKKILTTEGQIYSGLVVPARNGSMVVLQSDGQKITLAEDDVEEISPSKISAMPEGLLNTLSLPQIADLMAYLGQPQGAALTRRPTPNVRMR